MDAAVRWSMGRVIPAEAGTHEHRRLKFETGGVHGSRVKPGMTEVR
jgi:hypothetical protein